MADCLNPDCSRPHNPDNNQYCHGCGKNLNETSRSYDFRYRFRLVKLLGQGGFGRTYKAEDLDFYKRPCVIKKLIFQAQGEALNKVKELFAREAQQLLTLTHPQIPDLYAYFEHNNSLYLVQEYIEGQSLLQELQQQGAFSQEKVKDILKQLVPVLDYLHSQQPPILHRDIKPDNIMRRTSHISKDYSSDLMLIDFGGAKELVGTGVGTVLYTPGYAAVEHILGKAKPASDIYSLGATCVRLLTGCLPSAVTGVPDAVFDEDDAEWQWQEYLQQQGKSVDPKLAEVLNKMLARSSKNRYQSAEEVLAVLQPQPVSKPKPPQPVQKTIPSPPPSSPQTQPTVPSPLPVKPASSKPSSKKTSSPPAKPASPSPASETKTINRSQFLKWLGFGGVGTVVFGSWLNHRKAFSPSPDGQPHVNLSSLAKGEITDLKSFSFPVITVNARGEEVNRETKSAQFLTVGLGNGVTMDLVAIPGGEFLMGSPSDEEGRDNNESPQHQVIVPAFLMGKYQVTQAQYEAVMGNNPARFKGENRPVERVSWNDCVEFCNKLSQILGRQCRLPSEAEWEYACRAGTTMPFHFGETITTDLVNFYGRFTYASAPKGVYRGKTTEVGSFSPNGFGLYDMHGNVEEWCLDDYHDSYNGAPTDGSAWLDENDNDSLKFLRGCAWNDVPRVCRSSDRSTYRFRFRSRTEGYTSHGFRVVVAAA